MNLWYEDKQAMLLRRLCGSVPYATARLSGSSSYANLRGTVSFYPAGDGTLVTYEFTGLPYKAGACDGNILGLHIHSGEMCTGNAQDPFAAAGAHFNPGGCQHPYHAGDMPPVFVNRGFGWGAFYTERFTVWEILNKTVILHSQSDDFKTQPAGDSGARIACGIIMQEQ